MARQVQKQPGFGSYGRKRREASEGTSFVDPKALPTPAADRAGGTVDKIDDALKANSASSPEAQDKKNRQQESELAQDPKNAGLSAEDIHQMARARYAGADAAAAEATNAAETAGESAPAATATATPAAQPAQPAAQPSQPAQPQTSSNLALLGGASSQRKQQKRKRIRTIVAISLALLAVIGFVISIPFKLLTLANTLFNHNNKINDHIEKQAEKKVMERLFSERLNTADGGQTSKTGNFIHDTIINMSIKSFKKKLASDGINMQFDAKNRFVGFEKDGLTVRDLSDANFWEKRQAIGDLVDTTLGPGRYLRNALYTKAMRAHAGVSFKFWIKDKAVDVKDILISKVREGIFGDETLSTDPGSPKDTPPDPKTDPNYKADSQAYNQQKALEDAGASSALDAANKEDTAFNKFKNMADAHAAGIEAFKSSFKKVTGVTGIVMIYCIIQAEINKAIDEGYVARMTMLMREGNMIITQKDQMQAGDVNADQFGQMMSRLDGDPRYDPSKNEAGKDFTKAAAWKRATGQPVSTAHDDAHYKDYNPDISESALPDGLTDMAAAFQAVFNIPGSQTVCSFVNSWFGWVLQGVELVFNIVDAGIEEVITTALSAAFQFFLLTTFLPKLIDALTNLSVTGVEDAVQTVNNSDAGLAYSTADYMRMKGDRIGTPQELSQLQDTVHQEEVADAQSKSWTYRVFDINNDNSLIAKVVENIPSSPAGTIASIRDTLWALPTNMLAVVTRPHVAWAADNTNPYHVMTQLTTDADLNNIDGLDAECFLNANPSQTVTYSDNCPHAAAGVKTRLQMLGDPTTYTPADGDDPNAQDLMHCFVNTFRNPYDDKDPICLDLGVLTDNNNPTPQNPGQDQIINQIYCKANQVCGLNWSHQFPQRCANDVNKICGYTTETDFDIYRIYLKWVWYARGLNGQTTDTDPFAGAATP